MKKRIFGIWLTLCMCVCIVPANAFAAENGDAHTGTASNLNTADFEVYSQHSSHCLCGGNEYDGHSTHTEIEWQPWEATDTLPLTPGYFYLLNDVTVDADEMWASSNTYICLNGKKIRGSASKDIYFGSTGGELCITDCTGSGSIGDLVMSGKNVTLYGGTIAKDTELTVDRKKVNFLMTGNAKNEGMLRVLGYASFTMNGNAQNDSYIILDETNSNNNITFGGQAGGKGTVRLENPQEGAALSMNGNAKIAVLNGTDCKLGLTMEDNAEIGDVIAEIKFTDISLSGNAKLGSNNSLFIIKAKNPVFGDNVKISGKVIYDTSLGDCVLTLGGKASVNGELTIENLGSGETSAKLIMKDDSVINGRLICDDDAVTFEMQGNAKVDGDIDVGNNSVNGRVTCTGDIRNGIFDANGEVVNNGMITGGTFYGKVSGTGTIEDSATLDVTFDTDGGSAVQKQKVLKGQRVVIPSKPTKDGYNFIGWYNGETEYDFNSYVIDGLTLTAHWKTAAKTVIKGLQDGETYLGEVRFTAESDDGIAKVEVNGNIISPNTDGSYTLLPSDGQQTVTVTDGYDNVTTLTVTVNAVSAPIPTPVPGQQPDGNPAQMGDSGFVLPLISVLVCGAALAVIAAEKKKRYSL